MTAAPRAAEAVDLASDVRDAQRRIARAIQVGEMRGDPLCDVLEAISTSLGVQLQLHEAATARAQLPVDPAALVRLEEAAATGADRGAAELAQAQNWRTIMIAAAVLTGGIMGGIGFGYWAGRHSQIATDVALTAEASRDGADAVSAWLTLARANDARALLAGCTGKAVVAIEGRRACGVGVWLDPPKNPAPATVPAGK